GINEGKVLTNTNDPEKIADFYLHNSRTKVVMVKVGSRGSFVKIKTGEKSFIPGFKVKKVVDTVGAGDGFALGVITALLEGKSFKSAALRGNAIGALQVQTPGDNDGYPDKNELKKFFQKTEISQESEA
uniref:carbohydrate kinase family protein n=1 Tax=Liquorilactobacillus sicerae TaxID=1416943 RepID=UPI00247FC921